jgi:hypothetical protein
MVCLRNICINTLHKGDNGDGDYDEEDDSNDDDENNHNDDNNDDDDDNVIKLIRIGLVGQRCFFTRPEVL